MKITSKEFFYTTAEEEAACFVGECECKITVGSTGYFPPGNYRVIDGELFLVVDGVPPIFDEDKDD